MTIIVKNGFCKTSFLDKNDTLLATLKNAKLFGAEKVVVGPDKIVKYETDIQNLLNKPAGENRQYTLKQDHTIVATAHPVYAADADYFAIPRPPRSIGLVIQMQKGPQWRADRDERNAVKIWTPDGIAALPNFFSFRPQAFGIPEGSDIFLWAGVYAMIGYMMHEDEIPLT